VRMSVPDVRGLFGKVVFETGEISSTLWRGARLRGRGRWPGRKVEDHTTNS
jgi:hypothetical protein